ncbi:Ammonium transporter 1 [Orchesella cincta]|uniref:Ammonium transporter 1 n=1 Tax=Orchesella cincta TaxID=48709 RepID=A0A1D2NMF4_ORCCI|nr:Ammonium transporter 1 [Orchesella cincta]
MANLTTTTPSLEPAPGEKFAPGDTCFILVCTALVWLMIPGVGYFYSGMARSKSALSLIMLSMCSVAVVSIQWFLFGYSLTFSDNANFFIGDFKHIFLRGVWDNESMASDKIPELVFCLYQAMFAGITPALAIGIYLEMISHSFK